MNDLDERLTRAGEQFRGWGEQPPSLDAMLDVATRPRHRVRMILAVAASVVAVAGVAIAVPLARSTGQGHSSSATRLPVSGVALSAPPGSHYVGDEKCWGTYCSIEPVAARIVSQTEDAVTIADGTYAAPIPVRPGGHVTCPPGGVQLARLKVVLDKPLGTRALVDAADGATQGPEPH
jgi:hypothetical protein